MSGFVKGVRICTRCDQQKATIATDMRGAWRGHFPRPILTRILVCAWGKRSIVRQKGNSMNLAIRMTVKVALQTEIRDRIRAGAHPQEAYEGVRRQHQDHPLIDWEEYEFDPVQHRLRPRCNFSSLDEAAMDDMPQPDVRPAVDVDLRRT